MIKIFSIVLWICLLGSLLVIPMAEAETELGGEIRDDSPVLPSAQGLQDLDKETLRKLLQGLGHEPEATTASGMRKELKVELLRVTPRQGNNPLDPQDPINNTTVNGRRVGSATDNTNNSGGGTPFAGCIGRTITATDIPQAPGIGEVSILINPQTFACSTLTGNSQNGAFLIFDFQYQQRILDVFPDTLGRLWQMVDPIPTFGSGIRIQNMTSRTLTVSLISNNGFTVRGVFRINFGGAGNSSVTIVDLVRL